jgi:hypothetical protein
MNQPLPGFAQITIGILHTQVLGARGARGIVYDNHFMATLGQGAQGIEATPEFVGALVGADDDRDGRGVKSEK